ncbi:MAG: hypothetical protein KF778_04005 [Rhodocyclaceae bacterium]|nr:hypothetical protein [Rhodocyclaceae bacterium]MBX3667544.1 hypothetical protein [Rhodocyclaceae bacterium]
MSKPNEAPAQLPHIRCEQDAFTHAGQRAVVEGIYQQEDVRMMQVNPPVLHLGHAVLVLDDGCRVFLYPPASPAALRDAAEIRRCENRRTRASGVILPRIPQDDAVQQAPCLVDVESIEPV